MGCEVCLGEKDNVKRVQRAENSRGLWPDSFCDIGELGMLNLAGRKALKKRRLVVGLAMIECPLVTPRSRNRKSKRQNFINQPLDRLLPPPW